MRVKGADWKLEMGTLAEIVYRQEAPPAILFEDIPDYPRGFRAVSGSTNSSKHRAITLGFPVPSHPLDVLRASRARMKAHQPRSPGPATARPLLQDVI